MSALAHRPATETVCTHCGARLAADQDWCLECGAAVRTRISAAPDWRVPLAIVGAVVTLAAAALIFMLVSLSNSANRSAAAAVAAAPATKAPPAAAPAKAQAGATTRSSSTAAATTSPTPGIASWPAGVKGFTVVLGVIPAKAAAKASATKIASAGIPVGLLYSSDYSSMSPGDWIVFSGTYTTQAKANAAASQLHAKGQTGAYSFSVVPAAPGTTSPAPGTTSPAPGTTSAAPGTAP